MQEKIYVRAVLLLVVLLIISAFYTWYPKMGQDQPKKIPVSATIPVADYNVASCQKGEFQSPINVPSKQYNAANKTTAQIHYEPTFLKVNNSGKTVETTVTSSKNTVTINQKEYQLEEIHFHSPSEHQLNGQSFDMEMHLVHKDENGDTAVLGVFINKGNENEALTEIWNVLPKTEKETVRVTKQQVNLERLLPKDLSAYYYVGSLTTPPCTEGVEWIVLQQPIEISTEQLEMYQSIFPKNNRPIQPLNERDIRHTEVLLQ